MKNYVKIVGILMVVGVVGFFAGNQFSAPAEPRHDSAYALSMGDQYMGADCACGTANCGGHGKGACKKCRCAGKP